MLGKLLKYDLKHIFKFWWVAAAASFAASFVGAVCISILDSDRTLPAAVEATAVIGIVLVVIAFIAFSILGSVAAYIRFHKNLFTDEGYLTFTLPVKIGDIVGSKLIASVITVVASSFMILLDLFLMFWMAFGEEVPELIGEFFEKLYEEVGPYLILYMVEGILISVAYMVFSTLLIFVCISIAKTVAKKAKVITAIGVYYLCSNLFSYVTQMLTIFGSQAMDVWTAGMSVGELRLTIALVLLAVFLLASVFGTVLYIVQYRILKNKLNLA